MLQRELHAKAMQSEEQCLEFLKAFALFPDAAVVYEGKKKLS